MAFVTAALVVALYSLARRLGARADAALLVAVGAVAGTFVLPYGKEFFSEPLTALCLVVAIERLLAGRSVAAGLALGAAVLVARRACCSRRFCCSSPGARTASRLAPHGRRRRPGIAATFAYNIARFGHPLRFGYEDVGFTTPLLTGIGGLLFEPTKSLLLFAPIIVLLPFALWRLWRGDRAAFVLIAGNFGHHCGPVAMWFAWHGGWCWGPRLLIPGLMPAIAAVGPWLVRTGQRRAAALLFALGFGLSLPALIVPTQAQQLEADPAFRRSRAALSADQPLASPSPVAPAPADCTDGAVFYRASLQRSGRWAQLPAVSQPVAGGRHARAAAHRAAGERDNHVSADPVAPDQRPQCARSRKDGASTRGRKRSLTARRPAVAINAVSTTLSLDELRSPACACSRRTMSLIKWLSSSSTRQFTLEIVRPSDKNRTAATRPATPSPIDCRSEPAADA